MPVPWESLIPFGLVTIMFGVTGTGLLFSKKAQNDWKPPRYGIDKWDEMMMTRDEKLTGSLRGQSSEPIAPDSYNNIFHKSK
ncbi:small secreted protein [Dacryopinax primogenitus]|uniref:NADH dehydrogenase [ubiquinone] 1 alpha subcomplex subunit 1 n=1 Tax=Dacryopinax primogenitus (strain DJM 731) TaxID=1858805 RepID=M5GFH9_DACPD|nr:small secreted protein [Dacryopinax primogenitus]EJU06312.1 small secreted protein [Dacryopinax primogenitus]